MPTASHCTATTLLSLGFVGMEVQRSLYSRTLRGVGRDAGYVLVACRLASPRLAAERQSPAGWRFHNWSKSLSLPQ
ncbi:hypothetical protein [Streptomyces sp. NPDC056105]|uniref:hypothetical protein n=1 Tax=Streptomyces sp. NPDC056105 TaxID=3345714 RepID=UPI0035D9216D